MKTLEDEQYVGIKAYKCTVIISAKCFIAGERIIQVQALIYREEHHTQRPRNALSYCTTKE